MSFLKPFIPVARRVQWTENESRYLLSIIEEEKFVAPLTTPMLGSKGRTKYREIYEKIAHLMAEDKGYRKTAGQCKVKWKHMKASFMEAIKKQDRMLCPIYFDQMYHLLEKHLEKEMRNVAKAMLVPDFCQPAYKGRAAKKGSLNFKINALKYKEDEGRNRQEIANYKNVESSRSQRQIRPKKYKFILPAPTRNSGNMTGSTLPLPEMAKDWCVPVKMENDSDIVIKEEPLNYDSDEMENEMDYENLNEIPSFFVVPPANPSQQPQQQTPQPSPQVQPQPSPPPVVTQKKSSLPPLAPKPVGNKLPQSSGAQNVKQPPKLLPKPQSPPEVCLRWNSYHSNMQNTFPSLLNNEQFVDVTLACDGRSIKCHKVMLSACSPYMEELLSSNPCQHPIIFLKDMKFWQLQALVDFMYRGEVNVTQDKLPNLLSAAEALQIKGLASPVNHTAPPKITQVQPMPTTQHDLSDEMDQVTYMRQLQLKSEVKPDYDDEYMQDTDDSPPPTPKLKKRKTSHTIPQSQSHNNGTLSSNGNKSLSMDIKKERKRDKERHSEPSTSQHILSTAQALLNQQNEQRRRSDADKLTDSENEYKNYGDDNRHGSNQDEDLDIDEEHAQMILERYSSQNEDCYSRGGDGDLDDNSTTSG